MIEIFDIYKTGLLRSVGLIIYIFVLIFLVLFIIAIMPFWWINSVQRLIDEMNEKARVIAKKWGRKHKNFTFGELIR